MKPAEEILKDIVSDNMDRLKQTFGDTVSMKVQDITGKITPSIAANLVTGKVEEPEESDEIEYEDSDYEESESVDDEDI